MVIDKIWRFIQIWAFLSQGAIASELSKSKLSKAIAFSGAGSWVQGNIPYRRWVCMLVRVLFDNNGDKVSFLTADKVCTLGRVLGDNADGEEEVDEAVGIVE